MYNQGKLVGPDDPPLGAKALLGRVKRQSLISFMASKRLKDYGNRDLLRIPAIDVIINEILNPSLVKDQLLPKRLHTPVIEIMSRGSCGKTHLLYLICAISTLPDWLNGKSRAVVIIDCKSQFYVNRLYVVMKGYAVNQRKRMGMKPLTDRQLHTIIKEALRHVHIFRTNSSRQLLETIKSIKPYLYGESEHKHFSARKQVDCILVDGISDQIWKDRWNDYNAVMVSQGHPDYINLQERYESITNELRELAESLSCFIVATNIGFKGRYNPDAAPSVRIPGEGQKYRPRNMNALERQLNLGKSDLPRRPPSFDRPYLKHCLPQPWTSFVNVKLVVRHWRKPRPRVKIGLVQVRMIEHNRRKKGKKKAQKFVGFSDTIGLGGGLQRKVRAINNGTGHFYFSISEDGVKVGQH